MKKLIALVVGVAFLAGLSGEGLAAPPATMYTLEDIYDYLMKGVVPTKGGHNPEPPVGASPGDTRFKSLEQILDGVKAQFDLAGAKADNVEEGVTFWSTNSGSWGVQTGEMASGGGLISTGQTTYYEVGDDGWYKKGAARDYTANDAYTVTDNVTGLMWAAKGNAAGCYNGGVLDWTDAIVWAEGLTFGGFSDWRLPNSIEIMTLMVEEPMLQGEPYINQTYFPNTFLNAYWSSTSYPYFTFRALCALFNQGYLEPNHKTTALCVRAVRGGE